MYSAIQKVSRMHKRGSGCMQTILLIVQLAGSLRNLVGQNTPPYVVTMSLFHLHLQSHSESI